MTQPIPSQQPDTSKQSEVPMNEYFRKFLQQDPKLPS